MRKIKVYDELSVYAQRMLELMANPGYAGLDDDIYENEDGWVLTYSDDAGNPQYLKLINIKTLDRALSKRLIEVIAREITCYDRPEDISAIAELLIIEEV